ncbi:MAG: hypothetical protein JSW39_23475, partial [Desulfobacterales bacterium]
MINIRKKKAAPAARQSPLADLSFQNILDHLPCYISIQDRSLHVLFVNQAFKDDFGDGTGHLCHMVYKKSATRCPACPVLKTFTDK